MATGTTIAAAVRKIGRLAEHLENRRTLAELGPENGPRETEAEDTPDRAGDRGIFERLRRRLLVERVDQAADGRRVIVSGNAGPGRTRRGGVAPSAASALPAA